MNNKNKNTPNTAEDTDISVAGVERAVPRDFSAKKNIIIIIIAAVLLIGVGITAVAVVNSHSASSGVAGSLQLAERYLSEQNYEQAVIEFQKVLEIEPMNVDAYLGLTEAYLGLGNTSKARQTLNKGIKATDSNRLRKRLESVQPSSSAPTESSTSIPDEHQSRYLDVLTSADVEWLLEPTYEFDEVVPIRPGMYTDLTVTFFPTTETKEDNFPSYSYVDDFCQVRIGNEYKVFFVPDKILSLFSYSTDEHTGFETYGNTGILAYTATMDQLSVYPWKDKVFPGGVGGGGDMGLFWDSYTHKAYLYCDWEGELEFEPVQANTLNSRHRVQMHDLSSLDSLLTTDHIKYTNINISYANGVYYDEYISPVYEPVSPKYALWSPEDELLTDFIYDDMLGTSCGITAACRNEKWGYLDSQGNEITEFIYDAPWISGSTYDYQTRTSTPIYGAFPSTSDTMVVVLNGEYGVLHSDGRTFIEFGEFEALAPAWNDQLWAKQNGKWGLIDLTAAKRAVGYLK